MTVCGGSYTLALIGGGIALPLDGAVLFLGCGGAPLLGGGLRYWTFTWLKERWGRIDFHY